MPHRPACSGENSSNIVTASYNQYDQLVEYLDAKLCLLLLETLITDQPIYK